MFRELTRKNQRLSSEECVELLKNERRGVLSVHGEDGYPYGMPMNHWYDEESGKIYFHSGKTGHRSDALKRNDKVSFCIYDKGVQRDGKWPLHVKSVIVFGTIKIVEDGDRIAEITTKLSLKFTQDEAYIKDEIRKHLHRTILLELTPEQICGKSVEES